MIEFIFALLLGATMGGYFVFQLMVKAMLNAKLTEVEIRRVVNTLLA